MCGGIDDGMSDGVGVERFVCVMGTPTYRGREWAIFAHHVLRHVDHYTVHQYGDGPDDNVETWTEADIKRALERYIRRMGQNARGDVEAERDLLKIAHYAGIAWSKRQAAKNDREVA